MERRSRGVQTASFQTAANGKMFSNQSSHLAVQRSLCHKTEPFPFTQDAKTLHTNHKNAIERPEAQCILACFTRESREHRCNFVHALWVDASSSYLPPQPHSRRAPPNSEFRHSTHIYISLIHSLREHISPQLNISSSSTVSVP